MTVTGLLYAGNVSLVTATGTVVVMEFTMSTADVTGLTLTLPCSRGVRWNVITPSGSVSAARTTITLYASEMRGTLPSGSVDWTPVAGATSTVPPADPLSGGAGTIEEPTITLVAASVSSLALHQATTTSSAC